MISHDDYRRALLANPRNDDAALAAHRAGCEPCQAFTDRLQRFESSLDRAFKIPMPKADVLPFKRPAAPRERPRWYAFAASAAAAVLLAGVVWLAVPRTSLAADVVAHMAGELDAWHTTQPVPSTELASVLQNTHMQLTPKAGEVSYASSCPFRGHKVPHLVVQSAAGAVTVMVLVHESVAAPREFDEQGYRGTIVPVPGHGSIAVLMRGGKIPAREVDEVAARVRDAIVWVPSN